MAHMQHVMAHMQCTVRKGLSIHLPLMSHVTHVMSLVLHVTLVTSLGTHATSHGTHVTSHGIREMYRAQRPFHTLAPYQS